jgi:8-oxo-dGTP pyrophosphatase MutT (NUDIX family)
VREFWEETNIPGDAYDVIENLSFTEIFTGTNNVKYKHVYFVATLKNSKLVDLTQKLTNVQRREVSEVSWKTLQECKDITRPHYTERKAIISKLERTIQQVITL